MWPWTLFQLLCYLSGIMGSSIQAVYLSVWCLVVWLSCLLIALGPNLLCSTILIWRSWNCFWTCWSHGMDLLVLSHVKDLPASIPLGPYLHYWSHLVMPWSLSQNSAMTQKSGNACRGSVAFQSMDDGARDPLFAIVYKYIALWVSNVHVYFMWYWNISKIVTYCGYECLYLY